VSEEITKPDAAKLDPKAEVDYKAKFEELSAQVPAITKRLEGFEKLESERKAAADKKAQEEQIKAGEAGKIIAEKDDAIKRTSERLLVFEKREKERAADIFKALPADRQEALKAFEGKLDLTDWVALLEKEPGLSNTGIPPAGGGGRVSKGGKDGEYEPSDKARQILTRLGKSTDSLKSLEFVRDDEGNGKFRMQVGKFFSNMKKAGTQKLALNGGGQQK
jgi:hypothetical protein